MKEKNTYTTIRPARGVIGILVVIFLFQETVNAQTMNIHSQTAQQELATLGAGCFWCVEAIFQRVEGVLEVKSGYSGGQVKNPSYQEVCTGKTGHAEVCQIVFDPGVISYARLLDIFWKTHDPTTLNQQGNDVGTQYRSVIFYHTEAQKRTALAMKDSLNAAGVWERPVVTEITPYDTFYPAEAYHDNYYNSNRTKPYCTYVITPKVKKLDQVLESYPK